MNEWKERRNWRSLWLGQTPRGRGPRVPRRNLGCRILDVLGLHCLWANKSQRGQDPSRPGAAHEATSTHYPAASGLIAVSQGQGRQVSWRVRCGSRGPRRAKPEAEYERTLPRGCLELAVTAAYDLGTCSSRLERPSRAPGKWRVAETGNYISQKAGKVGVTGKAPRPAALPQRNGAGFGGEWLP